MNDPVPPKQDTEDSQDQQEIVIHVRDRRKPKQYIVDNLIMDEYHPLIGNLGYSIYSLLVRMSNERDGEQARASLRMMCAHLGIESRAVLGYYITLMEMCGLLFKDLPEVIIIQGGKRVKKKLGNRSSTYYILDVKPVTKERLKEIKTAVATNNTFNDTYKQLFLRSIKSWKPIQQVWSRPNTQIKTIVGQMALDLDDQVPESAPPPPATLQEADPKSIEILRQVNITKPSLIQQLGQRKPDQILALIWYGRSQSWLEDDRISGYVIKNLAPDGAPPPKGFLELAKFWLEGDLEDRQAVADAYIFGGNAKSLAEDLNISLTAAKAAAQLSSQYATKNHLLEWLEI